MRICVQDSGLENKFGTEKGYALIAQAGFTAIDWNIDRALPGSAIVNPESRGSCIFEKPLEEVIAYYEEQLSVIRKNGLTISQAHAPFPAYSFTCPEVLDYMIEIYKRCIELCDYVGCKYLIVHPISLIPDDTVNTPESVEKLNMHLYESLIPTLLRNHVIVCLENMFGVKGLPVEAACSDAHEVVRYIDTLNAKAGREVFGFCVDTGHLQLLRKDFRTFIPILGKRIKCLHIHDNDGQSDAHRAPMTGRTNWKHVCDALREIGYDGDLSFETCSQVTSVSAFDEELVFPWLCLIAKTGECFRKHIQQ